MLRKALLVLTLAVLAAGPVLSQTEPPTPPDAPAAPGALGVDAAGTREQLGQLLQRHPSDVGRVLALSRPPVTPVTSPGRCVSMPVVLALLPAAHRAA